FRRVLFRSECETEKSQINLTFFSYEFEVYEISVTVNQDIEVNAVLKSLNVSLSEVEITARKEKVFELSRMQDVDETAIYAGKKTEVVLVEQSMANLASKDRKST